MLVLFAIAYALLTSAAFFVITTEMGLYCARRGSGGSEMHAKAWASGYRAAEVVIASVLLYVLWGPILHFHGNRPGAGLYVVAGLYALIFGSTYVLGSLAALVTIPIGDQRQYFAGILSQRGTIDDERF
jgi:hypothetical protein